MSALSPQFALLYHYLPFCSYSKSAIADVLIGFRPGSVLNFPSIFCTICTMPKIRVFPISQVVFSTICSPFHPFTWNCPPSPVSGRLLFLPFSTVTAQTAVSKTETAVCALSLYKLPYLHLRLAPVGKGIVWDQYSLHFFQIIAASAVQRRIGIYFSAPCLHR